MRHLIILVILGSGAPSWAAGIEMHARAALLAKETGASTRAPAWEATVGGRLRLAPWVGLGLSYRAAIRNPGSRAVSTVESVQRLQLGPFVEKSFGVLSVGAELGAYASYETSQLRSRFGNDEAQSRYGMGAGLDLWSAVRLSPAWSMSVGVGAYQRRNLVDLTLGIGTSRRF